MAKVYFDLGAVVNGVGTSSSPFNALASYTILSGDDVYFRRGNTSNTAFTLVSGTPGKRTRYTAWFYPDGSDDTSQPMPIFNLTAPLSTYSSTNKENIEVSRLDLRAPALTVANDTAVLFLGHNSTLSYCNVDTNVGCVAAWGKSNVLIGYNTLTGVSHSNANGNNLISVGDTKVMDYINIIGNTLFHKGGGNANSHGIRAESASGSFDLTNLIIDGNSISPPIGTSVNGNIASIGIRIQRCPGAKVRNNRVYGMRSGVFVVGGGTPISVQIAYNNFSNNLNFGVHLTTDTVGCVIERNTCNNNGTNDTAASAYGRGIELSSAAGQGRCGYHVVRYNTCNGNKNYGGPADNGSEGAGIGLDDGTVGCYVYGNTLIDNEGNGIQQYSSGVTATWSETGGHYIIANFLRNNCTAAIVNRRTGGNGESPFVAQIALAGCYGRPSHVANNVIVGGKLGVSITTNCTNVYVSNNVFHGIGNAVGFDGTPGNCYNNLFWKAGLSTTVKYCKPVFTANAPMTYTPLSFSGNTDIVADPQLDSSYRPVLGSPVIGGGYAVGSFKDAAGRQFRTTPSVGMFENYPSTLLALHL